MDDNPYAAPQVSLVEPLAVNLDGWRAGQLRVLAYLSLSSALGTGLLLGLSIVEHWLDAPQAARLASWLGPLFGMLGCYLLIRLKQFAEQRFAACHLARPTWALVLCSLVLLALDPWIGQVENAPVGVLLAYFAMLIAYGLCLSWLGLRLLQAPGAYPALHLLGWLDTVSGLMCASILLLVPSLIPAIAAYVALAAVFFTAARECEQR